MPPIKVKQTVVRWQRFDVEVGRSFESSFQDRTLLSHLPHDSPGGGRSDRRSGVDQGSGHQGQQDDNTCVGEVEGVLPIPPATALDCPVPERSARSTSPMEHTKKHRTPSMLRY